jgi:hypothetical protein
MVGRRRLAKPDDDADEYSLRKEEENKDKLR